MKKEKNKPAKTHKSDVLNEFFSTPDKNDYEKTEKNMLLAVRIENAIKEKGYNKVQFAGAMNVQPSVITKWLSGTHNFTIDTLFDIERVLCISIIHANEPAHMQTINRIYVTVSVTNTMHSHPFYLNCSPQKDLVKLNDQKFDVTKLSMSTQKEIKEELINFQIRAVDLINSSIQSPKTAFTDQQSFNFNISVEQKLDHNNKSLIVITHVEVTATEDLDYKLATCSVACLFGIENYSDVVKIDKAQITINPGIIDILNSISFSTTRGVMSQILRGTYLHHAILPIVDPKTFKKIQ